MATVRDDANGHPNSRLHARPPRRIVGSMTSCRATRSYRYYYVIPDPGGVVERLRD